MPDHVHLLVELHPTVSVSALAKEVKGASSHAAAHLLRAGPSFRWQTGYGAFSVSHGDVRPPHSVHKRSPTLINPTAIPGPNPPSAGLVLMSP